MIGLTPRQSALLAFIEGEMTNKRVCPSYPEMAVHLGLSPNSKGYISHLIGDLEDRGFLRRLPGRRRAIILTGADRCGHCGHLIGSDACRRAAASPVKSYSHSPAASRIAGSSPGGAQAPQPNATGGNNSDLPVP